MCMSHSTTLGHDKRSKESFKIKVKTDDDFLEIEVFSWSTIHVLKEMIQTKTGIKVKEQRLFLDFTELVRHNQNMFDYNITKGTALFLAKGSNFSLQKKEKAYVKPHESFFDVISPEFSRVLQEIKKSWLANINPQLTENGTSGTYLLKSVNKANIAIFKPYDEEPFADNNPKGYPGILGSTGFRPGIKSGESATREVAAFLLDLNGFHNVPETIYVGIKHHYFEKTNKTKSAKYEENLKYGSLQLFKKHHDIVGNYGCLLFSVRDVHRIAILDIRILNCDRNEENILVRKSRPTQISRKDFPAKSGKSAKTLELELIPIDHGLSFPDNLSICSYEIVWMEWPQIQQPFSKDELDFINALDPEEDVRFLQKHLKFREICLRNFRLAGILLKKCANAGFSLYQIGSILYKEEPDELSVIEKLVKQTETMYELTKSSVEHTIFVTNLIKKTRFLSKNRLFRPVSLAKAAHRAMFEDRKSAKDDGFVEQSQESRLFKRKIQRNFSHRGNLNNLETDFQEFSRNPKTIIEEREENEDSDSEKDAKFWKKLKQTPEDAKENAGNSLNFKRNVSGVKELPEKIRKTARNLVKKVISMPNLNGFAEGKCANSQKSAKNGKNSQYDEIFFYYFEGFLDQYLQKRLNRKRLSSQE